MENFERTFNVSFLNDRVSVPVARDILACVRDFQGSVYIEKDGRTVSAGSMVGILSLSISNGDTIKVSCFGGDDFAARLCLEKIGNIVC